MVHHLVIRSGHYLKPCFKVIYLHFLTHTCGAVSCIFLIVSSKIHLSFSLERELLIDGHRANVFIIFLKSVGIVLTDVQNVVFK